MNVEHKSFEVEVKSIEDRTVTGIASVFGNVDSYGDEMQKGSFKKTIKERHEQKNAVKHLWQHDFWSPPIAKIVGLKEVGRDELSEKARSNERVTGGLQVSRQYLETPRGDEVLKGIVGGAITEMSFAFDIIKADMEDRQADDGKQYRVRLVKEVRLYETSDVLWGANELTSASKNLRMSELMRDLDFLLQTSKLADVGQLRELGEKILGRVNQLEKEAESVLVPLTPEFERRLTQLRISARKLEYGG